MDALDEIIGHLGAAQIQRAASDDKIIAVHIDAALDAAKRLRGGCSPDAPARPMLRAEVEGQTVAVTLASSCEAATMQSSPQGLK